MTNILSSYKIEISLILYITVVNISNTYCNIQELGFCSQKAFMDPGLF